MSVEPMKMKMREMINQPTQERKEDVSLEQKTKIHLICMLRDLLRTHNKHIPSLEKKRKAEIVDLIRMHSVEPKKEEKKEEPKKIEEKKPEPKKAQKEMEEPNINFKTTPIVRTRIVRGKEVREKTTEQSWDAIHQDRKEDIPQREANAIEMTGLQILSRFTRDELPILNIGFEIANSDLKKKYKIYRVRTNYIATPL
jgi:hypothetical protein